MGGAQIKQHMETAKRTGCLALSDMKLDEIPHGIETLASNLRTFDCTNNRIKVLPNVMSKLKFLKSLNFNKNALKDFPEFMMQLRKLETLNCNHNQLSSFPIHNVSNLTNLKQIDLSFNKLALFPVGLCELKYLNSCNLSKNSITAWPEQIGWIQTVELNLNQNQLTMIPDSLCTAGKLKVLRLEENCININSISIKVLKDSKISVIAIEGNLFSMKQFQQLDGYEQYQERFTATKKKAM